MRHLYTILCTIVCLALAASLWGQEGRPRTHAEIHIQNGELLDLLRQITKSNYEAILVIKDDLKRTNDRIDASVEIFEIMDKAVKAHDERIALLDKGTRTLAETTLTLAKQIKNILEREKEDLESPILRRPRH